MIQDAEKFKDQDELVRKRVEAKNSLEQFVYSVKQTVTDEKLAGKISDSERSQCVSLCDSVISWISANQHLSVEEYERKKKELEAVYNPIMSKLYGQGGPADPQGFSHDGFSGQQHKGSYSGAQAGQSGPNVDDVE